MALFHLNFKMFAYALTTACEPADGCFTAGNPTIPLNTCFLSTLPIIIIRRPKKNYIWDKIFQNAAVKYSNTNYLRINSGDIETYSRAVNNAQYMFIKDLNFLYNSYLECFYFGD